MLTEACTDLLDNEDGVFDELSLKQGMENLEQPVQMGLTVSEWDDNSNPLSWDTIEWRPVSAEINDEGFTCRDGLQYFRNETTSCVKINRTRGHRKGS